jgi:glucosamine 6-phosphate synthetase-like amidotransferase/phosphosugar isomerase protein
MVITEEQRLRELATISILLKLPRVAGGTLHGRGAMGDAKATNVAELLAPIPYIVPGQLFAQYLALAKGLNPDQPRGLTKVTRTL